MTDIISCWDDFQINLVFNFATCMTCMMPGGTWLWTNLLFKFCNIIFQEEDAKYYIFVQLWEKIRINVNQFEIFIQ